MLETDSALCPSARVASTSANRFQAPPPSWLIAQTTAASSSVSTTVVDAQADAIEDAADRQADRRADQRRPEVDGGVSDAIEPQVGEHRLGDQAEPLRAARQRREHHDRRDDDVDPAGGAHRRGKGYQRKKVSALP